MASTTSFTAARARNADSAGGIGIQNRSLKTKNLNLDVKKRFSHFWSTLAGKPAKDEIPLLPELQAFGCPVRRGRLHLLFTKPGRNLKGTAADTGSPFSSSEPAHEELMDYALVIAARETPCESSAEKLILLALATFENKGKCYPSLSTLSHCCHLSKRHVITLLKHLVDAGTIQVIQRGIGHKNTEYALSEEVKSRAKKLKREVNPSSPQRCTPDHLRGEIQGACTNSRRRNKEEVKGQGARRAVAPRSRPPAEPEPDRTDREAQLRGWAGVRIAVEKGES